MISPHDTSPPQRRCAPVRIGFVPLTDCAPLVIAQEWGLFQKYGLNVRLSRELGWASVQAKLVHGELDAAHSVATLPVAAALSLGTAQVACLTALVLNRHGNGITLSNKLWDIGLRDQKSLLEFARRNHGRRTLTFGVVCRHSSHSFLLRDWLAKGGLRPDRDVRLVVVPPPQMVPNLKSGNLDGFCAGEPWNSVAVEARAGWCAALSAELDPGHPEKVLVVRADFADRSPGMHLALVAALLEACAWCDDPGHQAEIARVLARPEYVGVPAAILGRSLTGNFHFGRGITRNVRDLIVFHRDDANEPSADKAGWVLQRLRGDGQIASAGELNAALGRRLFRADLFARAVRLRVPAQVPQTNLETPYENKIRLLNT